MPDSWLPPWLQPVADSVQSAADPFTDWLRSQQPANDVPPWQLRPIPPTNLDDITIEPPPNPLIDVSERTVEPAQPNPLVDSYRAEPPASPNPIVNSYRVEPSNPPPNPLVNSYQIEPPRPNPLVAPYRKPDPGPPHYDFTDAEGADFTAYRPTDPNDIEIIPPFDAPVGYMPPKGSPVPPGTPFDKPGEYVERDPRQTIEPDPMDTAGGFDAKVDEYRGDPELLLRAQMDRRAALEAMAAKSAKEQAEKEKADLERSIQIREQARAKALADRAQIEQDARALADGTPFGNWWASRSTGQKVSNYIAAIFGGLMQGSTGGRNSAIDLMMKAADDDANQKWKSLQMRREMSGEDLNDADAEYKFKETQRAASLQQMKNAVQAQMAGFDPQGKAAQDAGAMLAALDAAQAEQRAKGIADAQKQWLEAYKADSERMQAEAQMLNARSLEAQRAAKARGAGGGGKVPSLFGDKASYTAAEWVAIEPRLKDKFRLGDPASPFKAETRLTGKDVKELLGVTGDVGRQATDVARNEEITQQRKQNKQKFDVDHRLLMDGKPMLVYEDDGKGNKVPKIDPETGEPMVMTVAESDRPEMQKKITNAVNVLHWIDEAKAIRNKASKADLLNPKSAVTLRLRTLAANVRGAMKDGTQGMSSDADGELLARQAGVANLDSVFNQDAAIDEARKLLTNRINSDLINQFGYNGPGFSVPNTHDLPGPTQDEDIGRASSRGPGKVNRFIRNANATGGDVPEATDEQRAGSDLLVAAVERGDEDAPQKAAGLVSAATGGSDEGGRQYAAAQFWRLKNAGNPAAVAQWESMDRAARAAFVAHLPEKEAKNAFASLFPAGAVTGSLVPEVR